MGVAYSKEPDQAVAESIARRGCILRGIVGLDRSRAVEPGHG